MITDFSCFHTLTFDVVGTLIDFETGVVQAVRRLGGPKAERLGENDILDIYKNARNNHLGRASEVMGEVYIEMAKQAGLDNSALEVQAFQLSVLQWPAFPDSAAALARLRRRFRLVAMTNIDRTCFSAYENRLGYPFADSVTSDETLAHKPDPQFFAYTRGRQCAKGYPADGILHVAQSQYHDIGIAHKLGYQVCWVERRFDQAGYGGTPAPAKFTEPDLHVHSLAELADLVDKSRV